MISRPLLRLGALLLAVGFCLASVLATTPVLAQPSSERHTENVLFVTYDGLRWQELLGGADSRLMNRDAGGVRTVGELKKRFWRETPQERRETLLPFFWSTIAREGQVIGDPERNSTVRVTNGHFFSYPGYQEILCGYPDENVTSNAKIHNRNVTVLEWLNGRSGFEGRVAAVASWDVFPFIINTKRSGLPVNAGWVPYKDPRNPAQAELISKLAAETPHVWDFARFDIYTFHAALAYLKNHKPRVLYVAFDETDDWCHSGRYDLYLDAAWRTDRYIERLWNTMQSMPQYAGKTSLVMTSDHGRGDTREGWKNHGANNPGSDRIWIAVMGPDTPAEGLLADVEATQTQVAATVAALLGEDYHGAVPKSGAPLAGVIERVEQETGVPGQ